MHTPSSGVYPSPQAPAGISYLRLHWRYNRLYPLYHTGDCTGGIVLYTQYYIIPATALEVGCSFIVHARYKYSLCMLAIVLVLITHARYSTSTHYACSLRYSLRMLSTVLTMHALYSTHYACSLQYSLCMLSIVLITHALYGTHYACSL
jgi:hypothetical protein